MGRGQALLAGVVVLGALAACGTAEGVGPPPPPAAGTPAPDGPIAPPGADPLPAEQVDAAALPESYPRLVWTWEAGTVLGAYGQEGGCSQVRADLIEQGAETVRLRFVESTPTTGPCTMDLRFPPLSVPLDAPLGGRTVVLEVQPIEPSR